MGRGWSSALVRVGDQTAKWLPMAQKDTHTGETIFGWANPNRGLPYSQRGKHTGSVTPSPSVADLSNRTPKSNCACLVLGGSQFRARVFSY